VNDLVARVLRLTGSRSAVVRHPLPVDDPQRRRPDIALAGRLLGWAPRTGLEEGLAETIACFRSEIPAAANDDRPRAAAAIGLSGGR
jgi:UDP-glucuronate decarboxylase